MAEPLTIAQARALYIARIASMHVLNQYMAKRSGAPHKIQADDLYRWTSFKAYHAAEITRPGSGFLSDNLTAGTLRRHFIRLVSLGRLLEERWSNQVVFRLHRAEWNEQLKTLFAEQPHLKQWVANA